VAPVESTARQSESCEPGVAAFDRREFAAAAAAFDQCINAHPADAYTYYRAGLAYYEINRLDLMVTRFESFVRLAPDAPERPEVESILRTARARPEGCPSLFAWATWSAAMPSDDSATRRQHA
jgi:tetratricopeptide (TPR) repeat protein